MKIRTGFVSNSSSASFVAKIKTLLSFDEIAEYIKQSDTWIAKVWNETQKEVVNWKNLTNKHHKPKFEKCKPIKDEILVKTNEGWEIRVSTTMFNDWMDISVWKFIRALSENRINGIELDKIIKVQDEYADCSEEEKFNIHTWSWNYLNDENEPESSKKETLEKEEEITYEYLYYLSKINSKLTLKEELYLSKNLLTKY